MAERKRTELDWEDVRVFLALARHASLSAAARALSVNHATVARRIRSLETALGERLVERRPDGYVLTASGTRVVASASAMDAAAAIMVRHGCDDGVSGLVRINAPPSLSQAFLAERVARLVEVHPELDIEIATDFRAVSLERGETDIALRYGRPDDGDVLATRLVKLGFGFYATKGCCARATKTGATVLIGFDEANAGLPEAKWLSRRFPRARVAVRANGQIAQAAAAKAGVGFALLPHFIGRQTRGLILSELAHAPPSRDIWLLKRPRDRQNVAFRAVGDFLVTLFSDERAFFEEAGISP